MPSILDGIRVLDFGRVGVGPWACVLLGYMGADVIRVERVDGDLQQELLPLKKGMGCLYITHNFGKKNIMLDLKTAWGKEVAYKLVEKADVFVTNLRPKGMERIGFGYEDLSRINPRLVYCSSPGYGHRGPLADQIAADPYMEAYSGFASMNGKPEGNGECLRWFGVLDIVSSIIVCQAVMLALLARETKGAGQKIETSQLEASIALQATRIAEYFATGKQPKRMGSASSTIVPSQAFRTLGNDYINVSACREEHWSNLCKALAIENIKNDPRFRLNANRVENRDVLIPLLEDIFREKPATWWLQLLRKHDVPCGPYSSYGDLCVDPHVLENRLIVDVQTPWGVVKSGGLPWVFSKTPARINPPPLPDGNRAEILSMLGCAEGQLGRTI